MAGQRISIVRFGLDLSEIGLPRPRHQNVQQHATPCLCKRIHIKGVFTDFSRDQVHYYPRSFIVPLFNK